MTNQSCLTDELLYHTVEQGYHRLHLHRIISSVTSSEAIFQNTALMYCTD